MWSLRVLGYQRQTILLTNLKWFFFISVVRLVYTLCGRLRKISRITSSSHFSQHLHNSQNLFWFQHFPTISHFEQAHLLPIASSINLMTHSALLYYQEREVIFIPTWALKVLLSSCIFCFLQYTVPIYPWWTQALVVSLGSYLIYSTKRSHEYQNYIHTHRLHIYINLVTVKY